MEGEKRWWFGQKRRQICIRLLENCLHLHTFEIRLKALRMAAVMVDIISMIVYVQS